MAKFFATLIDEVEQEIHDTSNAIWTTTELAIQMEDAIREVSEYLPYVRKISFAIESRTGTATTDTADALVDTTEDQFLTTDTGKVIHNTQNNTWAVVSDAQYAVSDDKLVLTKDIMVDGDEKYEIFNKGCTSKYQINLEDVTDWVGPTNHGVIAVEYPIGQRRNWTIEGDILTIKVDSVADSKVEDTATDTEVLVWFETRQRVSQLTDLAGTVNGTPTAGATTFTIAAVGSGTEVIAEDTLFTFYGSKVRGTYKVKYDLTLSSGGGDIVFWPGLESAPSNGDIVFFIGSTFNRELERLVVELTAAQAVRSKAIDYINVQTTGGPNTARDFEAWGERKLGIVLGKLQRMQGRQAPRTNRTYPRD